MTESDFIKAIQLLFPKGNPLREFADFVSKGNSIEKLTSLLFVKDRLESEHKLAAFAQLYSPNNNHTRYLEGISSALSECNNRIVQLTDKVLQDEMQKKVLDNIREIMNRSGF